MAMTKATLKAAMIVAYEAQTETTYVVSTVDGNVTGTTESTGPKVASTEMDELFDVIAEAVVAQLANEGVVLGASTASTLDVG